MPDSPIGHLALIDAFTATPFRGNPAMVCLLNAESELSAAWLQSMAIEFNQPATAFLRRRSEGDGFDLRWFSARYELELCGHGTLASTHFLFEAGLLKAGETAQYHTRAGLLSAQRDGEWIELDFPAKRVVDAATPSALQAAIGENEMRYVGQNGLDLFVELASEEAVRALTPNLDRLAGIDVRGAIFTARGTGEFDCVSRFFSPRVGGAEDAVTGSAHCAIAPYWAEKLEKTSLLAYQASARGGVLRLGVDGERVRIGGQAVTVWRGSAMNSTV